MSKAADYQPVLDHIERSWPAFTFRARKPGLGGWRNLFMRFAWVRLPYPAIAPNDRYFAGTQFYWDTYFTVIGLVVSGRTAQAKQMVDNLCFLFDKFGLVPARNSLTSLGRSQPPFLTRMAYEVYEAGGADRKWLRTVLGYARREYEQVWQAAPRYEAQSGLSRYRPRYLPRLLTGYESGWDLSSRFRPGQTGLLPVDLNCLLYQYEADFAGQARMREDTVAERHWQRRMDERRERIDRYFWDEKSGFYYDHDSAKRGIVHFKTLAGFYPLWCGAASEEQARRCVEQLAVFEQSGGLASSEKRPWRRRQWDYCNGWPPLQYVVITGLRRYGYHAEADRLTRKWLDLNLEIFQRNGKLWEKYDVISRRVGKRGRYPTQPGFAWTDGVFLRLLHDLKDQA
jgi:alpha,alpha-trehalase